MAKTNRTCCRIVKSSASISALNLRFFYLVGLLNIQVVAMGPFTEGWTERDVEAVIAKGDPSELLYVPIVVGMNAPDCEREWAEEICFKLANHPNFNVRGNAILGLGHIARTCRALNLEQAIPAISRALADQDPYVRGHADDAASDLKIFLGVSVPGHESNT